MIDPASLKPFDAAEHLNTPEAVAAYLEDIAATGDADLIAKAMESAARSAGGKSLGKPVAEAFPDIALLRQSAGVKGGGAE